MSEKLRIGFAGGNHGRHHMEAFATLPDVELTALADTNDELRKSLESTFGIPHSFESVDELIAAKVVDALVIATPTYLHERHSSAAIDADLHVLCEGPPATTESDMSRISSAAGFTGRVYMWAHEERFNSRVQEARARVESGELGKVYHASARWHGRQWSNDCSSWRYDAEKGGGALLEFGTQIIDTAWFAMGCPDPVEAFSSSHKHLIKDFAANAADPAEDSAFGIVRFKNGSTLSFEAVFFTFGDQGEDSKSIELWGSESTLSVLSGKRERQSGESSKGELIAEPNDKADRFAAQAKEFVASIREEREPLNNRKEALSLVKLIDSLGRSAKEQKSVSIRTIRDLDDLFGGV